MTPRSRAGRRGCSAGQTTSSRLRGPGKTGPCSMVTNGPGCAFFAKLDHTLRACEVQETQSIQDWTIPQGRTWSRSGSSRKIGPYSRAVRGPGTARVKILDHAVQFSVVQKCRIKRDRTMDPRAARSRNSAGQDPGPRRAVFRGPEMWKAKEMDHGSACREVQETQSIQDWTTF